METGEREKNGHFSTIGDKTGGNGTEMIKHTHTHTQRLLSPPSGRAPTHCKLAPLVFIYPQLTEAPPPPRPTNHGVRLA